MRFGWKLLVAAFCPLLTLLGMASCGQPMEPLPTVKLRVAGATSMVPVVTALSEAYKERSPQIAVEIQGVNSSLGVDAVKDGRLDFGLVSRELTENEIFDPKTKKRRLWPVAIAIDGIAIIVHPANQVDNLTLAELRGIFAGEIRDWSDLGGGRDEIQVISREEGSGTRATFEAYVMRGQRVTLTALVMPSTEALLDRVSQDRRSIAYVSLGSIREGVKPLRLEGVEPTIDTVKEGSYPLQRPFLLVAPEEPKGEARAFLDFILSPTGQAIVEKRYLRIR